MAKINAKSVAFYVGATPVVVGCELTSGFNLTGITVDTSSKCSIADESMSIGYGATVSGNCFYVEGDTGCEAIRNLILAATSETSCQFKTINGEVFGFGVNFTQWNLTAANKGALMLDWAGTVTGAITIT